MYSPSNFCDVFQKKKKKLQEKLFDYNFLLLAVGITFSIDSVTL